MTDEPAKPPKRSDQIQAFLLENVEAFPTTVVTLATRRFGVSRQAVNKQIRALIDDGALVKQGATSGTAYKLTGLPALWSFQLDGLSEHEVWDAKALPLLKGLPENVLRICEYGFTEMLNNAIDHSESERVRVAVSWMSSEVCIEIADLGVGIFNKIQRECGLDDTRHAVFELTKGKLTTDPARHTGEGVFFTSRMFDRFSLYSGGLFLSHDSSNFDWLLGDRDEEKKGTIVTMHIAPGTRRTTAEVFDHYATEQEDYAFSKTQVVVLLADMHDRFVSRSQGKRIVARLERFKEVVLDFARVPEVGPAFADEVFRVFAQKFPDTHLVPVNANEQVTKMIQRATNPT